jgi:hypothetical protein
VVLGLKKFISYPLSIKVEKRRFSAFELGLESMFKPSVQGHQQKALALISWIIHSDSGCGLLLPIQITDSYGLNVTTTNPPLQSSAWM